MINTPTLFLLAVIQVFGSLASKDPLTLIFLGDSLTDGDGVADSLTFVSRIGKIDQYQAINQGRSGWATSSYLRRWEEVQEALPATADYIFIQLGANDLRIDGHKKSTVDLCRQNMETILSRLKTLLPSSQIVLMSSTKLDTTIMKGKMKEIFYGKSSNGWIDLIGQEYRQLANEKDYGFIDLHNQIPDISTHDGAHLSNDGHQAVAGLILDYLVEVAGEK